MKNKQSREQKEQRKTRSLCGANKKMIEVFETAAIVSTKQNEDDEELMN